MSRKLAIVFFSIIFLFLCAELVSLWKQKSSLEAQYGEVKFQFDAAQKDRDQLKADLLYLSNPVNLEKELRDRLHYQAPGEKVIILVPKEDSATGSPSSN